MSWSLKRSCVASIALVCLLVLTGCYKVQVVGNPKSLGGEEKSSWQHFFIGGLVGSARIDVREFCGGGEATSVETSASFANGLVSTLTGGIYTPRTVTVTCATGSATGNSVTVYGDDHGRPVHVTATVDGRTVQGHVSATQEPGVVMASIPALEAK